LQAVTRRQFTTFFKQTIVGNHYSCLQKVVREQFLRQRGRRGRRGNNRYRGGENPRYRRGGRGRGKSTSRNTGTRRGFRGGQQSHQQSEEEEQQEEDEVKEPREEVQDAAMAKECDMTPRLQFWYGNSKDRTSIEWWCDAVDRIKDQKGWNNDQGKKSAASVAVDALREDASLLMSIIAKGHQAAAVKVWSLMKPLLIKRYLTIKTCTQRAKQFATLTQKSGEPVENFYDRTQMAMIIVHKKPRAAIPVAEVDKLRGYNDCVDGTQALLFVAGLLPYPKTFVDDRIEEDSTLEQILKWAVKGEQSRGGLKGQHSINAVHVEELQQPWDRTWAAEMTDMETRYKNLLSTEIAGVEARYKDTGKAETKTADERC
jgi:hypothetical protein